MSGGDTCNFTRTEWAQRTDVLFVTFCLEDSKNTEVIFEPQKIIFRGEGGTPVKKHISEIELFKEIVPEECKWTRTQRSIFCTIPKKVDESYWPRLTSLKAKHHWLHVDFNLYKDEDDSDDDAGMDMQQQQTPDLSEMMAQMGRGAGSAIDDLEEDSDDSDDEDLPGLETAEPESESKMAETEPVANAAAGDGLEAQPCDA